MFKLAEFFAEFKLKLIVGGIIVALLGAAYWSYTARGDKIDKLKTTVAVAAVANKSLADAVETQQGAAKINEDTNAAIAVDAVKIEAKHDKIVSKGHAKVASIEKSFEELPKTPENVQALDTKTSAALIDELWETYCAGMPDATSCAAPT